MNLKSIFTLALMGALTALIGTNLPQESIHSAASVLEAESMVETSNVFMSVESQVFEGESQNTIFLFYDLPADASEEDILNSYLQESQLSADEFAALLETEILTERFEEEDELRLIANFRDDLVDTRLVLEVYLGTDDPATITQAFADALGQLTYDDVSQILCLTCEQKTGALVYGSVIVSDLFGEDKADSGADDYPDSLVYGSVILEDALFGSDEEEGEDEQAAAQSSFSDVSSSYEYVSAVDYVKDQGIVQGYADGTYKPDANINRAEFTKILIEARYASEIANANGSACFNDVSAEDWFAKYVCYAKDQEIIGGYPDGTFKPAQNINAAEALKITLEVYFSSIPEVSGEWFQKYWDFADSQDFLLSEWAGAGSFLSRGAMAELIYRINN